MEDKIVATVDRLTKEQRLKDITSKFPYCSHECDVHEHPGNMFPWHFHVEAEIFYMKKGELLYKIPGKSIHMKENDVGFVNSNVLHFVQCVVDKPSLQQEHIFHPRFLSSAVGIGIEMDYISPLLNNVDAPFIHIPAESEHAKKIRQWLDESLDLCNERQFGYEIHIRYLMSLVWLEIQNYLSRFSMEKCNVKSERLLTLISFIQENYENKLSLKQIAATASISERECNRCFQKLLGISVFEYLTQYRLEQARERLIGTNEAITQIALRCGFSSENYFGKVFRSRYGCSPKMFRNQHLIENCEYLYKEDS